jgi:hypothetical protein
MRLSSRKAAHAVLSKAAQREIRVPFGRDDNFGSKQGLGRPKAFSRPFSDSSWKMNCHPDPERSVVERLSVLSSREGGEDGSVAASETASGQFSHQHPIQTGSSALNFVIPTGAKRSGGICGSSNLCHLDSRQASLYDGGRCCRFARACA